MHDLIIVWGFNWNTAKVYRSQGLLWCILEHTDAALFSEVLHQWNAPTQHCSVRSSVLHPWNAPTQHSSVRSSLLHPFNTPTQPCSVRSSVLHPWNTPTQHCSVRFSVLHPWNAPTHHCSVRSSVLQTEHIDKAVIAALRARLARSMGSVQVILYNVRLTPALHCSDGQRGGQSNKLK